METRALRNMRARGWGEGGGGEVLTWASGYNFPLFLVYPVDMPECTSDDDDCKMTGATPDKMVSTSAFLACHQF